MGLLLFRFMKIKDLEDNLAVHYFAIVGTKKKPAVKPEKRFYYHDHFAVDDS